MDILSYIMGRSSSKNGGSSKDYIVKTGNFSPSGTGTETITHDLGIVPDFFSIQWVGIGTLPEITALLEAENYSQAFKDKTGLNGTYLALNVTNGAFVGVSDDKSLDATSTTSALPFNATATTVQVGTSLYKLDSTKRYYWIAVGNMV